MRSAAADVADWIACMGAMPYFTMNANCFAAVAIRADTGIRAESNLCSGIYCLFEVLPLYFTQLAIVFQKIGGHSAVLTLFLNAFVVVNIHNQVRSMLLGEGNALVVDQCRVL